MKDVIRDMKDMNGKRIWTSRHEAMKVIRVWLL